jgi:membrane protease subunit HflC
MKGKIALVILALLALVAYSSFFIVEEGQQAIVTQFGRPVSQPISQAGLHFKLPIIQMVHYFEKRLMKWDGSPGQIPTRDKKYIWVDTTARWRIKDPLLFLQTVANERGAHSRLDDIIDSVVRDLVSANLLVELVRSADWKPKAGQYAALGQGTTHQEEESEDSNYIVKIGRQAITRLMLSEAGKLTPNYGIELVDIQIKRINYIDTVRKRVFDRMISERQRIASQLRSEGEGRQAEIMGQMQKELARIRSGAFRRSQEIKGKADAEATAIYGQAYAKDPEFYALSRTLQAYEDYHTEATTLVLTTTSEFFKYLKGVKKK